MNKDIFTWSARSLGSLAGFYLARQAKVKTWYPYVILGGLAGSVIASVILEGTTDSDELASEMARSTKPNRP